MVNSEKFRLAIYNGNFEKVNRYIKEGKLDISKPFEYARATIWHLLVSGKDIQHLNLLKNLLEENYDIIVGSSMLDSRDNNQLTPLHWAAIDGHIEAIKLLVSYGADPLLKDSKGHTVEQLLERNCHSHLLKQLHSIIDSRNELAKEARLKHQEKKEIQSNLLNNEPASHKVFEAYPKQNFLYSIFRPIFRGNTNDKDSPIINSKQGYTKVK